MDLIKVGKMTEGIFDLAQSSKNPIQITNPKMFHFRLKPLEVAIWFNFLEDEAKLNTSSEIFPPLFEIFDLLCNC